MTYEEDVVSVIGESVVVPHAIFGQETSCMYLPLSNFPVRPCIFKRWHRPCRSHAYVMSSCRATVC